MSHWRFGLDIGSTTAKLAVLDRQKQLIHTHLTPTSHDPAAIITQLLTLAYQQIPENSDVKIGATGYGRRLVTNATRVMTELLAHATGLRHFHPDANWLLDVGGQDAKALHLDADHSVQDFALNDRCAAGTGRFIEVLAARFNLSLEELCQLAQTGTALELTATCVVFAESEIIGLIAKGASLADILAGVHAAMSRRLSSLLATISYDQTEQLYFSGGGAKNSALQKALASELNTTVQIAAQAQFLGAIGAALLA